MGKQANFPANLAEAVAGKRILLTGASSGIGLAMAQMLARVLSFIWWPALKINSVPRKLRSKNSAAGRTSTLVTSATRRSPMA